jgi:hypothetical protein
MATRGTPNYNQLIVVSAPPGGPYGKIARCTLKNKKEGERKKIGSNLCINTANINVQTVHCTVYHNGIEYFNKSTLGSGLTLVLKEQAKIILSLGVSRFLFWQKIG